MPLGRPYWVGGDGSTTIVKTSVNVGATGVKILEANPQRKHALILNQGSDVAFINLGEAVVSGEYVASVPGFTVYQVPERWQGSVWASAPIGDTTLLVKELI